MCIVNSIEELGEQVVPDLPIYVKKNPDGTFTVSVSNLSNKCMTSVTQFLCKAYEVTPFLWRYRNGNVKIDNYPDVLVLTMPDGELRYLTFHVEDLEILYKYDVSLCKKPADDAIKLYETIVSFLDEDYSAHHHFPLGVSLKAVMNTSEKIHLRRVFPLCPGKLSSEVTIDVDVEAYMARKPAYSVSCRGLNFAMPGLDDVVINIEDCQRTAQFYKRVGEHCIIYELCGKSDGSCAFSVRVDVDT